MIREDYNDYKTANKANFIIMTGTITLTPEYKTTPTGTNISIINIAHNFSKDKSYYFRIKGFNDIANEMKKFIVGDFIRVSGYLEQYKNDGREYFTIIADKIEIVFESKRRKSGSNIDEYQAVEATNVPF